jgi:hypothetical protein
MTEIDIGNMVPGTVYRVTYERGGNTMTHEGNYIRREATATGDYLVFEPPPGSGDPAGIYVPTVRKAETID